MDKDKDKDKEDKPQKTYLISAIATIFKGVVKKPDSTFSQFSKALKATFSESSAPDFSTKNIKPDSYWTIAAKDMLAVLNEPNSLMFKLGNVPKNKIALASELLNHCLNGEDGNKDSLAASIIFNLLKDLNQMKNSSIIKTADHIQIIQFEEKLKACMHNPNGGANARPSKKGPKF